MSVDELESSESLVVDAVKVATGLVTAIPIYQDALQPLMKQAGKALEVVGQSVNAALTPLRALIWGIEKIELFVKGALENKLRDVPPERIITPDPAVACPALESLRYVGHNADLSNLYANLLASSMDETTAKTAHPAFVEIIRNLTSDEARVLLQIFKEKTIPMIDVRRMANDDLSGSPFYQMANTLGIDAGCEHHELIGSYLVNIARLGLIEIDRERFLAASEAYDRILNDPKVVNKIAEANEADGKKAEIVKYVARLTQFGHQFSVACVIDRNKA